MNVYAQARHIFWKEYRTQRSIWLGITLIIVVLQGLTIAFMPGNMTNPFESLISIGAILTTFYALGSAGVLFAGEREEETDRWLMILPTSRLSLVSGKVLWLISSWLLAIALTTFTAYLPYWGTELDSTKAGLFGLGMLRYGGSMVAWGLFFSIVCRRVYTAIALATIAFLFSASMVQFVAGLMDVLTVMALVGSVVAGRLWLSSDRMIALPQFSLWTDRFNLERALSTSIESSPGWKMFRRQLWLEWRNARWIMLGVGSLTLLGMLMVVPHQFLQSMCLYLPLIFGLMSYRGEHRRDEYRFRGNRGVSPLSVWSAKQIVWLGSLVVALSVGLICSLGFVSSRSEGYSMLVKHLVIAPGFYPEYLMRDWTQSLQPALVYWSGVVILMYASAQICSLLIGRGVSAALVAIVAAVAVSCLGTVTIMFDVPEILAFFLPAVCLLGFCLWRTSELLSERKEPRDWWRTINVLALLGLVCASSWVTWRLTEITMPAFFAGLVSFIPVAGLLQHSVAGGSLLLFVLIAGLILARRKLTGPTLFLVWSGIHIGSSVLLAGIAIATSQMDPPDATVIAWLTDQEARETDQQYRELALQMTPVPQLMDKVEDGDELEDKTQEVFRGERAPSEEQLEWLAKHQNELDQLLAITRRNGCGPDDEDRFWRLHERLAPLLRLSAVQAERENDLESAWSFHLAFLRMQRYALERQTPTGRSYVINSVNHTYQFDLWRWLNHPQQSPELLDKAAQDYTDIVAKMDHLGGAIAIQEFVQRQAISENSLDDWEGGDGYEELAIRLSQGLYHLPWETARARMMLDQVYDHQSELAKGIRTGENRLYYQEIASPDMEQYGYYRWSRFETYPAWEHWGARSSQPTHSDWLWQHTQTTTIFKPHRIENFGEPPHRGEWTLVSELQWIRGQRLFLLGLAFRAAELESGERPESLSELAENRDIAAVDSILSRAENFTGEIWNYQGNRHTRVEFKNWHHRLYFDPITDRLFMMSEIQQRLK